MPGRHRHPKVGWRLPPAVVKRLRDHTTRTGTTATTVVTAGITAELDRLEHGQGGGPRLDEDHRLVESPTTPAGTQ